MTFWKNLLEALKDLAYIFTHGKEEMPTIPVIVRPPEPSKTPTELLSDEARKWLGRDASPLNSAPQELACAESVSNIAHNALGTLPANVISTVVLCAILKQSGRFRAILEPKEGCIVVSPTEGTNIGHTGIFITDSQIASNDSRNGLFESNYSFSSWIAYFKFRKGLHIYIFEPC